MKKGLIKGGCGDCGNETFTMYSSNENEHIICECTKCKSTSEIVISKPKLEIKFGKGSTGRLAFYKQ